MKKTLLPMFATASMIAAAILTMPLSVYFAQEPVAKTGAWTGLLVDQDCVTKGVSSANISGVVGIGSAQ